MWSYTLGQEMLSGWAVTQPMLPTEIWRSMKTNMWSRESVSLLAGEISNFIPEIYPCYSHRLFIFNLKNNQNANTEYKLLNDVKGQEQGGRDGNRKKKRQ